MPYEFDTQAPNACGASVRVTRLRRNLNSWDQGFVNYPSAKDKEISLEKRAGHSIVLVDWDDEQEMSTLDEEGQADRRTLNSWRLIATVD